MDANTPDNSTLTATVIPAESSTIVTADRFFLKIFVACRLINNPRANNTSTVTGISMTVNQNASSPVASTDKRTLHAKSNTIPISGVGRGLAPHRLSEQTLLATTS